MYKAKTGEHSFDININDGEIFLNGRPFNWDKIQIDHNYFHILVDNKSYRVVLEAVDHETKVVVLKVNGKRHDVTLQDKFDLLLEKMGMNSANAGRVNSIKAPMPGLIIDLKVKDGDTVKINDPLIVLEAMKMENVIKSPGEGTIKAVKVRKGESVEKSQILIEFN